MHELINKFIEGRLTSDEEDRLWMNVLNKPLWYDYFMTEITSRQILKSSDRSVKIDEKLLEKVPEIFEQHAIQR